MAETDKGQVTSSHQWTGRLDHPANMGRYDELANDPETGISIELLAGMIAGPGFYTEMPEKDDLNAKIDPNHKNKVSVDNWARNTRARPKFLEIENTKLTKGFCPVEKLENGALKCLPPESFFIWRDKKGHVEKYTQEFSTNDIIPWKTKEEMDSILLFIHHEDTSHPYGHSILDRIADLVDARKQINVDMPKIIHRYSNPRGVYATEGDVQEIYDAVINADVDEDIFFGKVNKDTFWFQYLEPSGQVRFLEYINQIYFLIGESLHAPLILLLKNATEASATIMMDSVELFVTSEQQNDAQLIEDRIYKPMVGIPTPLHKWGAPKAMFDEITLTDIATLYSAKGEGGISLLTWEQGQDLIRQKGIPLMEATKPEAPSIFGLPKPQGDETSPGQPEIPLLDAGKMNSLEMSLKIIKETFLEKRIMVTEAIREGDRAIQAYVDKSKAEAKRKVAESLGKPVERLSPESERCFELIRNELFDGFRESILPTRLKGVLREQSRTFTVTASP